MAVKCILTGQTPSVLDGVTENVQTQINNKQAKITADGILKGDGNGNITAVDETETELVDLTVSHITGLQGALDNKVSKVTGKDLSTNDYTTAEKTKLSGIAEGAQKNTITGVKGGSETSYRTGNVNITATNIGLGNVNNTSDKDKPISTATQTALNGKQATVTGAATTITGSNLTANRALVSNADGKVAVSDVTSTELGYLDGVTSAIQTQLNGKVPTSRTVNNKALNANITLGASDVGAVPTSRTVNGKALSSNITLSASDVKALPISGGTLTGNLTGKYITGTWLQATDLGNRASNTIQDTGYFATIDNSGWVYQVPSDAVASSIGVTHQNLFVNGNFQIWQRYPSGTYTGIPNNRYIADRWIILSSDGSKTNTFTRVDPCGIHNGSGGANCTFVQHIKNASMYNGQQMTYSVLKSDSSGNVSLTSTTKKAFKWTDTTDIGAFFGTDSAHRWIGPGETVYGVKLEVGSAQTLAHKVNGVWVLNEIPSVTIEMLRCKRYFTQINGATLFKRADAGYNNSTFQFFIPLGIEMVANPSASDTPKIYSAGNASSALTQATGFSFNYTTLSNGVVRIIATRSSHGLTDAVIALESGFQLIADV